MTPITKDRKAAYRQSNIAEQRARQQAKTERLRTLCEIYDDATAELRASPDSALIKTILRVAESELTTALETAENRHFEHKKGHYLISPTTGQLVVRVERETRQFKPCPEITGETKWQTKGFRKAVRTWQA